jgi:hypothetical protein
MNTTLDHCETPFVFWMGCDDELHLGYLMACMMAWYTRAHEEGIKALGATTNCIKETRVNGEVFRQEFPMASSPVYPVDLIRQYKYDEKISHGIDGGFQKHFIDQGYTFLKVEMPMYLYRFHEDQLSRGIHYDQDVKDLEELSPELGMTLIKDIQDTKKQVMNRDSRRKKNR